jgi:hypothetical protein
MWGMIALGLLILFLFVGYQAAMKVRGPSISVANTRDTHNDSDSTISAIPPLSRVCVRTRYGIAGTNRIRVISDGTPKRFGGPQ